MKKPGSASSPLWYKDAILYELHVRAFADSNGDGIGDFPGLITKLDYLQDLGVTCLWLLPFFPSPLRDDGYDIADYTSVNPSYGTLDDFQNFLDAAHERGIQVLVELVMNHSSDQHPWFQRARRAPRGSAERDFYVWSDDNTRFPGVPIIFNDTEKSNWQWDDVAQQYYWHRFFSHQPDLNFDNPLVLEEMLNVMRFWLDRGVDGLRLDAIPYLIERDGTRCESLPETHAILRKMRAIVDSEYTNRFFLAEANQLPAEVRPYFGDGDECHMAFHFPLMPRLYVSLRQEDRLPIVDIMQQTPPIPDTCQWGIFLRNHDELTLEMVTDDERDYMWLAYSADPRTRVNVGIRRRLAPLLDNNRQRIELLNSILFSFPGTPILYYGDELGMGDNVELGDRNGVRTPMQWNSAPNAGFSTAAPDKLYFPVIDDPVYGYQAVNVEEQLASPSSLLQWTRNMISLRKLFKLFGRGTLRFLHPANRKVLAYLRESGDDSVLCVANLSRFAQPVALELSDYCGRIPMEVLGYNPFPVITGQPYVLTLAPYSFLWFELQRAPGSITSQPLAELSPASDPALLAAAAGIASPLGLQKPSSDVANEQTNAPSGIRNLRENNLRESNLQERNGEQANVLVHLAPQTLDSIRTAAHSIAARQHDSGMQFTLTFPLQAAFGVTEDAWHASEGTLRAETPGVRFAAYASSATAYPSWPASVATYRQLDAIVKHDTFDAVVLLAGGTEPMDLQSAGKLAAPVLSADCALSIANYQMSRYEGLLNSALLRPLVCMLFSAEIHFPLAPDLALSPSLLESIAAATALGPPEEAIAWPLLHAIRHDRQIAQVALGHREFPHPSGTDVPSMLTRILNSFFSEVEGSAGLWQRSQPQYAVLDVPAGRGLHQDIAAEPPTVLDVSPMMDSFHLGLGNLQEVWSNILSPATLLGVKRTAAQTSATFRFQDKLWVRVVYDFLAAYRSRSVNRAHIFGAFLPLYMGWAASHLLQVDAMTDAEAEGAIAALCKTFEEDKPYLMARWRWPDRFTP